MELSKLLKQIEDSLFAPERRRHQEWINQLVEENYHLGGVAYGFMYMGETFRTNRMSAIVGPGSVEPIHESLEVKMAAYKADVEVVKRDRQKIHMALYLLLKGCKTPEQVKANVPACLVQHLPQDMANLSYDSHLIQPWDEKTSRQYTAVQPLIEMYAAAGLLY